MCLEIRLTRTEEINGSVIQPHRKVKGRGELQLENFVLNASWKKKPPPG